MVTSCLRRKVFGGENEAHILRSASPSPRHAIVRTNVSSSPMNPGIVSIVNGESNLVELNVLQHLETPAKRKLFSCNVTKFRPSHETGKLNFSSPPQPESLKLRSQLLMDKESLHTDLFVSRTSLSIERSTDSFRRNFSNVQLKNPYISPVSSPSPTGVVPLEPPRAE